MGQFIKHVGCPICIQNNQDTAQDNLSLYLENKDNKDVITGYCESCSTYFNAHEIDALKDDLLSPLTTLQGILKKPHKALISMGEYRDIKSWGISKNTCEAFNYSWGELDGQRVHIANFKDNLGLIQAQKIRTHNKRFIWLGDTDNYKYTLFGSHLWTPSEKIGITVCEGEKDALTLAQVQHLKYPVVGVIGGAQGAIKALKHNKEYLDRFKHVTLMFDGDDAGRKAQQQCAKLFAVDKVRLVNMPDGYDVHKLYEEGKTEDIQKLWFSASIVRPKDIVRLSDLKKEELYPEVVDSYEIPYSELNEMLRGIKQTRLYTICAGTGLGKSTFIKELCFHLIKKHRIKIGNIFLEQEDNEAMRDYIAMDNNINPVLFSENYNLLTEEQKRKSEVFVDNHMYFLKHFGSLKSEALLKKIEYLFLGVDCDLVLLDHISMVVSGERGSGDERKDIDVLMTGLRGLVHQTKKSIISIVHLRRPGNEKNFNTGDEITINDIRGSGGVAQMSDYIIALERNQQSVDQEEANICQIRVLKTRRGVKGIGLAGKIRYYPETGRLLHYEG